MGKSDILIVVKTYPGINNKHTETVCTAGIITDTKKFVRLYPIRFRCLEGDQQFAKYQWIKADIRNAFSDPRPESYHISLDSIELGDIIPVGKNWDERYSWIINDQNVFSSVYALRDDRRLMVHHWES